MHNHYRHDILFGCGRHHIPIADARGRDEDEVGGLEVEFGGGFGWGVAIAPAEGVGCVEMQRVLD
jgi:hypothetical protein